MVAAEEFVFQTWTLNRHPELVPRDSIPRDISCFIVSGHFVEVKEHSLKEAKRGGYYMFKRLSRISNITKKLVLGGGKNKTCLTLDEASAGAFELRGMRNQTSVWANALIEVPHDHGSSINREINCHGQDGNILEPLAHKMDSLEPEEHNREQPLPNVSNKHTRPSEVEFGANVIAKKPPHTARVEFDGANKALFPSDWVAHL